MMRTWKRAARSRGFTIIELLTVIAILAVLMAMIFPVATTMRQRSNQSACITNLQNIGQSLKLYRLDERSYPLALYGYVVDRNDNNNPLDDEPTTFLYPHYSRARRDFKCPSNPNRNREDLFAGPFQNKSPGAAVPLERVRRTGHETTLEPVTGHKIYYYIFDSYDGAVIPPRARIGSQLTPPLRALPSMAAPQYEQHYRRDWFSLFMPEGNQLHPMATRELLNRNPEDSTYVTTCTYHREYNVGEETITLKQGPKSWDIVLFLDGHAEKIPSSEVAAAGMGVLPKQS